LCLLNIILRIDCNMSKRPRRAASTKKIVIEISDSDEEVNLTADDDYRPEETKSRIIDRAADAQTVV